MSLERGPVSRPVGYGLEQGASGLCERRRRTIRPAVVRSAALAGADAGRTPGADEALPASAVVTRRLALGAATEAGRREAPSGREVLVGQEERASSDFADVVSLGSGRVALVLGDVGGGGPAAALRVSQALSTLRLILGECAHPACALSRLNRSLCGSALPAAPPAVALSLAVVDVGTGEAACACAGSEPPLILRAGGCVEVVNAGCVALGVDSKHRYRAVDFVLGAGDALLLATDGITAARRANGYGSRDPLRCESLCFEGLVGLALDAFRTGGPPGQMARVVLDGAGTFAGGAFHDDASVLVAIQQ